MRRARTAGLCMLALLCLGAARAAGDLTTPVSFSSFEEMKKWFSARRDAFGKRQEKLLAERYDLSDTPAGDARMSGGKPVQGGVRVKLIAPKLIS
ncbi:MAG: hypothetical protein HYZ75_06210 [Elusimicrobia bacterium]|nr:hypothetical protein [Elusimicrobiota bacterium]